MSLKSEKRYISSELTTNTNVTIPNFSPGENGKDAFGNRAFSSQLAYFDRFGQLAKAALIVTELGQSFLTSHKGVLRDIDGGLWRFSELFSKGFVSNSDERPTISLSESRTLTWIGGDGQSKVFLLQQGEERYIVKTNLSMSKIFTRYSQPYINEMLQVQSLSEDLANILGKAGLRFQEYLFATGYMSCTKYVEVNDEPVKMTADIKMAIRVINAYIKLKHSKNDPLWKGVSLDVTSELQFGTNATQIGNEVVWFDPFYFKPSL